MSGFSASRRRFLRQLGGAGALALSGLEPLLALTPSPAEAPQPFRFAFVTDLHLMKEGALGSAEGVAACLRAVEALSPRPDFILVGGDLVHGGRGLSIPEAERGMDLFFQVWNASTTLPARWVFGNHDLIGIDNPQVSRTDPLYGKGLFKARLHLPHLYYGFAHKGWRFVVLDDVVAKSNGGYTGELLDPDLAFARTSLDGHRGAPTIVCTHIPLLSNLALGYALFKEFDSHASDSHTFVCANSGALTASFPGHDIRAVLCGHLHHYERLETGGIPYINSGAVCGNFWRGPMLGCPEGFAVVDVDANGSVDFRYRDFGWKAI
jgi:Icc protein